jgi:hypothetical protein
LFSGLALAACNGTTVVDVNLDPTTGAGNIVVTGNQDDGSSADNGAGSAQVGNTDMSQVVLFGVIIALLLGTAAIVISATRRPREE